MHGGYLLYIMRVCKNGSKPHGNITETYYNYSKFNRRLNRVNFKAPPYFQFGTGIAILFSYVDIIQSMQ